MALVDDDDYEWLSAFKWQAHKEGYAARATQHPVDPAKKRTVLMHREILGLGFADPREVDHRDNNPGNNQRSNLRIATRSENNSNRSIGKRNKSGFKGVYRSGNKWKAGISKDGKNRHLGSFDTPEEAHNAYRNAAKELYGEFVNYSNKLTK